MPQRTIATPLSHADMFLAEAERLGLRGHPGIERMLQMHSMLESPDRRRKLSAATDLYSDAANDRSCCDYDRFIKEAPWGDCEGGFELGQTIGRRDGDPGLIIGFDGMNGKTNGVVEHGAQDAQGTGFDTSIFLPPPNIIAEASQECADADIATNRDIVRGCAGGILFSDTDNAKGMHRRTMLSGSVALALLSATVCAHNNPEFVLRDDVDLVEVNHFYCERGKHIFDQIIFYNWSSNESRYNVVAWRLIKKPAQIPVHNMRTDRYKALWHDGRALRQVTAQTMRESWTQYDPELQHRKVLPKEKRRGLRGISQPFLHEE